jgi:hypothetical protein
MIVKPLVYDALKQYYDTHPEVTGAELYACRTPF